MSAINYFGIFKILLFQHFNVMVIIQDFHQVCMERATKKNVHTKAHEKKLCYAKVRISQTVEINIVLRHHHRRVHRRDLLFHYGWTHFKG